MIHLVTHIKDSIMGLSPQRGDLRLSGLLSGRSAGRGLEPATEGSLQVSAPGTPPGNVQARAESDKTITVTWEEPKITNGVIKAYKVFYTTSPGDAVYFWRDIEVDSNQFMTTITGLTPNMTYSITMLAQSKMGEGPLSPPIQVFTSKGVPYQPVNLRASLVTANSIELTWTAPEERDNILSYELYINDSHFRQKARLSIIPPVTKYRLTNLTPDTVYNIKVAAKSARGEGPPSKTVQAQTKAFKPTAPPLGVTGEALSKDEVLITWHPPEAAKRNGKLLGYRVFVLKQGDAETEEIERVVSTMDMSEDSQEKKQSLKVGSLDTWTDYRVSVLAFTQVGDGPRSPPIVVKTDEDVPGEPRNVQVSSINSTTLMVEWQPPLEQKGIIRGYQVHYIEVNGKDEPKPGVREESFDVHEASKTEAIISGLKPDTRYLIQVAAYTRKGDGLRTPSRIHTTKGAVPSPPRNLHVDLVTEDPPTVKVTWQRPARTHGDLLKYRIIWGPRGERYQETVLDADVYNFATKTLDRGVTYEFRLSAKNEVDYGERETATIKTPDGVPSGAPQNLTAEGLTETSLRLSWDLPARHLRNGDIIMYQITYHKAGEDINEEDLNCTDTFIDLVGLEMHTQYIFKIKAYTSKGAGPWSNTLPYSTFGKKPAPPKNVKARRTSGETAEVSWDEPETPVAGYRIYYNMFATPSMYVWQQIETGPYTVAEITKLDRYTVYAIKVSAKSVDGRYGNMSETVTIDIRETQYEDAVQNFRVTQRLTTEVKLSWDKPSLRSMDVSQYVLRYNGSKKFWEDGIFKTIAPAAEEEKISGKRNQYTLRNLEPKMRYTFNISAIFKNGKEGAMSYLETETLIDAPPPVERPQIKAIRNGKILLRLKKASGKNGPISHYHLIVVPLGSSHIKMPSDYTFAELTREGKGPDKPYITAKFDSLALPPEFYLGNGQEYSSFHNRRLDMDDRYKVFLRAYSVDQLLYTSSDFSDEISITSGSPTPWRPNKNGKSESGNNNPIPNETGREEEIKNIDEDANALMTIVMPTCAGAVLFIIGCAIVCWVIMRKKNKTKGDALEPEAKALMIEPPSYSVDPVEVRRQRFQTPAMMSHPPIPIERLAEHIDALKASDNFKFSQEYESIEPGQQFTWDNSNLEVNKPKNRYANVIAYDHSRVILQPMEGVPGSDYVNANYMDGYRKQNAYIATQGPLPETFGDFWRMVWEQRSATIVMMTKLEERSRIKCDQYWPSRGAETYGLMHVQLVDVTELATYTMRTFHMSRYGFNEKREVRQYQFTAWPDHGVPDYPTPLLMFMRRVKASNPPDAGSIIVHCSAGVGRTGAFIVIDAMLERIKHEMTVDIYGHVTCLRAQRNYMVQTEDQYIFIHDALLEAVQCGNTEVPARNLAAHIQKLTAPEPGQAITGMELEFKRLANVKASPNRFVSANLAVNKFKNRLVNILPYETTRVCLQPIRGVDGSDYINASFIDGYRYKKAYVATQGPLAETTEDFWRMLWEHNSTIIVMLTKLREMGREKCHQYWPSERSARYQYFVVDPMTEYNMPQYILREFKVTDARDGQSRTIRQFQFTDWPEQGVPKSGEGFIDFIGQVHKTKEQFGQEGPISVHCSAGVGRTGVFITLSIVLERMRYEGVVDMFQTVKMLRTQRPAMVQTEDQFQFCYRAALEYLGSFDHYAN
ncbi:tyrosine-protein phosphatase lar [Plakobranchus ocellatus]|uniref:Tyrosine-protein phosphatase lar n=1 Tax=Plakobranchus ocellatus TaxID=259542 RepID=A0AAV3ZVK2_9GAST|nr:tyrosine-protein phosphatase lar [Plakobranchus ocellatus]